MSTVTITFDAKRSLTGGTLVGDQIVLQTKCQSYDVSPTRSKETNRSLSGQTETNLFYISRNIQMETAPIPIAENDEWIMFFDSVAAGETFTITDLDTAIVKDVKIVEGFYNQTRVSNVILDYWSYSFQVEEL